MSATAYWARTTTLHKCHIQKRLCNETESQKHLRGKYVTIYFLKDALETKICRADCFTVQEMNFQIYESVDLSFHVLSASLVTAIPSISFGSYRHSPNYEISSHAISDKQFYKLWTKLRNARRIFPCENEIAVGGKRRKNTAER
jgi:hypothetical protein